MLPREKEARARPRIGRYVITGRLGKGGMGMVYEGLDEALDRKVAIKTVTAEGAVTDESKRRFEIEAKAAARMQHPNIVAVYELNEDRGVQYIAMEFLDGTDLGRLLRSGEEILLAEKLDIAIQVCRGLAYAHERHVYHRDIKPDNIGLLDDGTAKIMDFGIAKMEGTEVTKTGMMVGTVAYMSPEQVRGQKLDGRTDLFSMGVILYQLVSGKKPFEGEGPSQILYKIVTEPPPPLDLSALGEAGPRLKGIVERALAKKREERYQGAGELADDLQKVLDEVRRTTSKEPDTSIQKAIAVARRTVRDGDVDSGIEQLRTLVSSHPTLVEPRRELRGALRQQKRRGAAPASPAEIATELQATFKVPPTQRAPETELAPTVVAPPARSAPQSRRGILLAFVAAVLALGVVGWFVFLRPGAGPPAPTEIEVRSLPAGATVLVDGIDSGVVTNSVVPVPEGRETGTIELTFRLAGHRDETRTVTLPLTTDENTVTVNLESSASGVSVRSTPAGARVTLDGEQVAGVTPLDVSLDPESAHTLGFSLDGHYPEEVEVAAGEPPETIEVELRAMPKPGQLSVVSSYPIDVVWRGRTLSSGAVSPQVSIAAGSQVVTLVAPSVFLRRDFQVNVPAGGPTAIEAPGVSEINIMARPENCRVLIGGIFVDYPPIRDRAVVVGSQTVTFEWPDGVTKERTVDVVPGKPAFVQVTK
jgi:serine/threonine protein kinase